MSKITKGKFKAALLGSGAILAVIAKELEVSRQAVHQYVERNPELKELLESERERDIDEYEKRLKDISEGDTKDSTTLGAVKYYLNSKARKRGFAERQEIDLSGKVDNKYEIEVFISKERGEDESPNDSGLPKD